MSDATSNKAPQERQGHLQNSKTTSPYELFHQVSMTVLHLVTSPITLGLAHQQFQFRFNVQNGTA